MLIKDNDFSQDHGWVKGQNDRTKQTGAVPIDAITILPTLSKPTNEVMVRSSQSNQNKRESTYNWPNCGWVFPFFSEPHQPLTKPEEGHHTGHHERNRHSGENCSLFTERFLCRVFQVSENFVHSSAGFFHQQISETVLTAPLFVLFPGSPLRMWTVRWSLGMLHPKGCGSTPESQ